MTTATTGAAGSAAGSTAGTGAPEPGSDVAGAGSAPATDRWWAGISARSVVGSTLVGVGAAALAGVVAGVGWWLLAPRVDAVVGSGSISISEEQSARIFGADGMFAILMVCLGVATAVLARGWLRRAGPFAVLGVAFAGIVGSVVAWRVGVWAGADRLESLTGLAAGDLVALPLGLRSRGLLLAWPIATVFLLLWISALTVDSPSEPSPAAASTDG